jgi:hypothetical protein
LGRGGEKKGLVVRRREKEREKGGMPREMCS